MSNELIVQEFEPIVKQSGLEKAEQYAAVFAPFMVNFHQLSEKAAGINKTEPSPVDAKLAREVRLAIAKNRTASEKKKDESKAALLAEGNLIQGLYNVVASASKITESDLEAVEKFAENKEKERKALLALERAAMFTELGTDLTGYDLGSMADNVFTDLLESQKLLHEKRIAEAARLEAERIAAEKAELERQALLKAENERLKKEADEAAAALEAERKETARLAKIESDKQNEILKAEKEKAKKLADELKATQDAAEKAQAELNKKNADQEKERLEKIAAEKKAAAAPDKEKLKAVIVGLKFPDFGLSTNAAVDMAHEIETKFEGFKSWALQQIATL